MQDLLAELTSGDDTRAENFISAIIQLGMAAIPPLLDLTRAEEVDSRWWAVRALAASPSTRTDDLIPLFSDSARCAALAMCHHPHECAVGVLSLLEVMQETPISIRILALRALSQIRDHRAIPAMMKSLSDESAVLQYWAQEGLNRLGLNMVYIKP